MTDQSTALMDASASDGAAVQRRAWHAPVVIEATELNKAEAAPGVSTDGATSHS